MRDREKLMELLGHLEFQYCETHSIMRENVVDYLMQKGVAVHDHGHWIVEFEPNGNPYCLHCSVCDDEFRRIDVDTAYPYCPWCGAKMDDIEGIYHETN